MAGSSLAVQNLFSVVGKQVVVTGGSRGIGFMIAQGFVENGAHTFITARNGTACDEAAVRLNEAAEERQSGGSCVSIPGIDLSSEEGCAEFQREVESRVDKLHVLINNSGTSWGQKFEEFPAHGFDKIMRLNVTTPFMLTQKFLPMLRRGADVNDPGRVINIGSVAGFLPQPWPTYSYDASKAAIHHLTRKLGGELAQGNGNDSERVTVNAIAPGIVPSSMSKQLNVYADQEAIENAVPLGRVGEPEDMCAASLYLSSRAGAWISGSVISVDGGAISQNIAMY